MQSPTVTHPLPTIPLTIHFPSSYQLTLKIPQQTTVHELTTIMRSYTILHRNHGLKMEIEVEEERERVLEPRFLETLDRDLLVDLYMMEGGDSEKGREMGAIAGMDFRIVYGMRGLEDSNSKEGFCPAQKYQFVGKFVENLDPPAQLQRCYSYLARDRQNCGLYQIKLIPKQSLTFIHTQNLLSLLSTYKKNTSTTPNPFVPILHTFETPTHIALVSPHLPFQLDRLKIDNKYLMDTVLGQVAKILHIMDRDAIGGGKIRLRDFKMDFGFRVGYCGVYWEGDCDGKGGYGEKLTVLLEDLMKNCNIRIIELYIPLFHWLKNKKISSYMDFLKYFQMQPPTEALQPQISQRRKLILYSLIQTYNSPKLYNLSQSQIQQFSVCYLPKTPIFSYMFFQKPIQNFICQKQNKSHKEFQELIENISTIKKKKQEPSIPARPVYQVRSLIKNKKLRNKTKAKYKAQAKSLLNNVNKTNKSRKHERKISEFLIED